MAQKSWRLHSSAADRSGADRTGADRTGAENGVELQRITSADFPELAGDWQVTSRRLTAGRSSGVHVVEIDNGATRIAIVPTRGMGLWKMTRGQEVLGWQSPVAGPVHPSLVPIFEPSGLGWLEGFDELMCRCGLISNGAPEFDEQGSLLYPLHGRIANLPADQVQVTVDSESGEIAVQGVVTEARFHFHKLRLTSQYVTQLGSSRVTWNDRVENFGGATTEAQMLYHVNIGEPLLGPGAQLIAPAAKICPRDEVATEWGVEQWSRYPAHDPDSAEQVYYMELHGDGQGNSQVLVKSADGGSGAGLKFSLATLPCFTQWRNTPATSDGYVTGIEPGTNFPNLRSVEGARGRVINLSPGCSWQTSLELDWLTTQQAVTEYASRIETIAGGRRPELVAEPIAEWVTAGT